MVYYDVNDAAGDEGRAYSTHGNTAIVRTFIVLTCERRWMYVEPVVLLSHVGWYKYVHEPEIQLPPPPLSSQLHTVTLRDNSFALNLRSAAILPGLLSYLSHSGMINVSFKQFDQPVFQNDGWYAFTSPVTEAGRLWLMKHWKFNPCSELFMWNTCSGYGLQIYRILLRNVSCTFTSCAWQTGDWLGALFIGFVLSSRNRV